MDVAQLKRDYYGTLFPLNPGGIIPAGPELTSLLDPHGRQRVGSCSADVNLTLPLID